jgi:hypothetical protein
LLYQSIKIAPACNKVAPYDTIIVPPGTKIAMSETKIELLGTKVALQGITIEYACTKVALARGKQGAVVEGLAGSIPYLFFRWIACWEDRDWRENKDKGDEENLVGLPLICWLQSCAPELHR